jgi:hypothetical protein
MRNICGSWYKHAEIRARFEDGSVGCIYRLDLIVVHKSTDNDCVGMKEERYLLPRSTRPPAETNCLQSLRGRNPD